ncbi:MAG: MFS transporter [Actinobacteria bacterium]|nr:MFS transporter [Actinomycetota bacterium]
MLKSRLVLVLQVSVGLLAAGYGVMFTMLDDWRDTYGIQETGLGFIVAVGFFTSFIAQLTLAPLADKGHARRMLTFGFALNVVGALVMAFGSTLPVFILGRTLMGIGTGISIPATRRIIIVSDRDNVGRNLGRGVSIEVGGFALGPMISALTVGAFGLAAPFLIMAALILLAAVVISRANVPETPPEDRTTEPPTRHRPHPVRARCIHRHGDRHRRVAVRPRGTPGGCLWTPRRNADADRRNRGNVLWSDL